MNKKYAFLLSFPSFPSSSFPFPSPFDLSFALKKYAAFAEYSCFNTLKNNKWSLKNA